jgi:predicted HicB family RNase H-like nuclease
MDRIEELVAAMRRDPKNVRFGDLCRVWLLSKNEGAEFMLEPDRYTYRVTWSEDDQEHVALCAEFQSLSWLAATPEDALAGIRRLVADTVADLQSSGEPLPEPLAARRYTGKFMVRVPPDLHRRLVLEAAEAGVSVNRLAGAKLSR